MKQSFTIKEMDLIVNTLMEGIKKTKHKGEKEVLSRFIKMFDAFYDESLEYTDKQRLSGEVKCEVDPWLIIEG